MGRAARPLHDPGTHRSIERGSNLQAARRGGLMKPAKPAGERENTAALTPSLGTRSSVTSLARPVLFGDDGRLSRDGPVRPLLTNARMGWKACRSTRIPITRLRRLFRSHWEERRPRN